MAHRYIIDGNNLIGKIPSLKISAKTHKQSQREKLVHTLERYFSSKKYNVSLHFDGFAGHAIKTAKISIHYSNNKTADELIKHEIELAKNPKLLIVVSSDHSVSSFARACACTVIKAEDFARELSPKSLKGEDEIIKSISNDEMKELFTNRTDE